MNDIEAMGLEIDRFCNIACEYADKVVDIDDFSALFAEDVDPVKAHQNVSNTENMAKSEGFLTRAFNKLKALYNEIKSSIQDFIAKRKLSKSERAAYDAFVAACKKNPELKNKKVTVKDWQRSITEGQALIDETAKLAAQSEISDTEFSKLEQKVTAFLGTTSKEATTIITANALLNMAVSNSDVAVLLDRQLRENDNLMRMLEDTMGKRQAKQYKKDVHSCTKKISLLNLRLKLIYKERTATECISNAAEDFVKSLPGVPFVGNRRMAKQIKGTHNLKEMQSAGKQIVGKGVGGYAVNQVKYKVRNANNIDETRKNTGSLTSGVWDYMKNGESTFRSTKRAAERERRKHQREVDRSDIDGESELRAHTDERLQREEEERKKKENGWWNRLRRNR